MIADSVKPVYENTFSQCGIRVINTTYSLFMARSTIMDTITDIEKRINPIAEAFPNSKDWKAVRYTQVEMISEDLIGPPWVMIQVRSKYPAVVTKSNIPNVSKVFFIMGMVMKNIC